MTTTQRLIFHHIYARLNSHMRGDIENVTFFHDEQVQFDDIIGNNKALAERVSHDGILLSLPIAD